MWHREPVRALVIYESLTGNTRKAAGLIATRLVEAGHEASVSPVDRVDMQALKDADLVVVGAWTDGFIFVGQRPGRAARIRALPVMVGKRCAVFCTYAIDSGRTLDKLSAIMRDRGADVLGGFAIRRDRMQTDVDEFVDRLLGATVG